MRRSRKQLEELVATTNSNLTKANLDLNIKVRNYGCGYTLHTNEGIETLCSGSLEKCDTYLRGINKTIQAINLKLILKTDSYPQSGTALQYKVEHNFVLQTDDEDSLNLPYRGK